MQCEAKNVLKARGTHNNAWMLHMFLLRISWRGAGVYTGTENYSQVSTMRTSRTARLGWTPSPSGSSRFLHTNVPYVNISTGFFTRMLLPIMPWWNTFDCSLLLQGSTSLVIVTPVCRINDLPAEALDNLFERLDYFTALHLASTCQPCATAFHRYRHLLSQRACHELHPVSSAVLGHEEEGPDLEGRIDLWWADMSAIEKIYWLSREPEFMEDMWTATWSHLFASVCCDCCNGQLCHGLHPPTNCHVAIEVDIMIKSNKMLQLPMQWLYNKFLGTAKTALAKALGTRFDQFTIILDVFRPGKVAKQAWKASMLVNPFNNYTTYSHVLDMNFVTVDYGRMHVGSTDWYAHTKSVEGNGLYLPANRQVLTVTGPWYTSSEHADFGNVVCDCKFKPIKDREFNDRWEDGWEYDERNYIQHHQLVHKADDTEYARIKATRSKSRRGNKKRIAAYWRNRMKGNSASARMKGNLASDIAHDLKEYYEDCDGSSCGDDDHSDDYSKFKDPFVQNHEIDNYQPSHEHDIIASYQPGREHDVTASYQPSGPLLSFLAVEALGLSFHEWPPLPVQSPSSDDAFLNDMLADYNPALFG